MYVGIVLWNYDNIILIINGIIQEHLANCYIKLYVTIYNIEYIVANVLFEWNIYFNHYTNLRTLT